MTTRPDASMSLLTQLMERPLDPSYEAAAQARRSRGETPRRRPWDTVTVAASAVVLGLLFTTSAQTFARPDPVRAEGRAQLVERIDDRQRDIDADTARLITLRDDIARLEGGDGAGPAVGAAADDGIASGALAVSGPGLRITLDDAAGLGPVGGGPREAGGEEFGRIISRDVQNVTNALWASGAEAIAVNGQRLTSTSAIRFAGHAILVGFRPLARPYVIEAVMGEDERRAFTNGPGGEYLIDLRTGFSARADARTVAALEIPAALTPSLRYARLPRDMAPAPTIREDDA
ncbi:MAG: DUF881 domain-containing protein [Mobilicoccus sp.]|nr:DUF881 domain-containing protein [Mobilicoccus sp.]